MHGAKREAKGILAKSGRAREGILKKRYLEIREGTNILGCKSSLCKGPVVGLYGKYEELGEDR